MAGAGANRSRDIGGAWAATASPDAVRLRARLNALVRDFFAGRGVLEVETPVLSRAGNTDPNIASFALEFSGRTDGAPRTRWLRTSAEFPMKRLLAAGIGDCYELGRVFRDGEAGGRHNPEFTMLEWYRLGVDHLRVADEAETGRHERRGLFRQCAVVDAQPVPLEHRELGVVPATRFAVPEHAAELVAVADARGHEPLERELG